jgi:hypothetical protein
MKQRWVRICTIIIVFLLAIIIIGCSIDDDLDLLETSINDFIATRKKIYEGDLSDLPHGTQSANEINILLLKIQLRMEKMTDSQKKRLVEIIEKYTEAIK